MAVKKELGEERLTVPNTPDLQGSAKPDFFFMAGFYTLITTYPEVIGSQLAIVWAQ